MANQPARWITIAAKSTVAASLGLAMGILGMVGGLSGAVLGGLERGDSFAAGLSQAQNALLFNGYTIALLTVGTILFYRRDVN